MHHCSPLLNSEIFPSLTMTVKGDGYSKLYASTQLNTGYATGLCLDTLPLRDKLNMSNKLLVCILSAKREVDTLYKLIV